MPDQHRAFFPLLPYLFTATPDEQGWPMASVLTGPPGFVTSPDPMTLRIDALPRDRRSRGAGLCGRREIGLLGLDLSTRRRNRANGRIVARRRGASRCTSPRASAIVAQYIQTRSDRGARCRGRAPVEHF